LTIQKLSTERRGLGKNDLT